MPRFAGILLSQYVLRSPACTCTYHTNGNLMSKFSSQLHLATLSILMSLITKVLLEAILYSQQRIYFIIVAKWLHGSLSDEVVNN